MSNLFGELKRRNVFRVTAAYAVAGWLLTEVASVILPLFGAPDWVLKVLVALLLLGFPLAVVFSWVYELTPEGLKREQEVERDESVTHHTAKRLDLMTMAMMVVGIGFVVYTKMFWGTEGAGSPAASEGDSAAVGRSVPGSAELAPEAAVTATPSIAVLPFADMSVEGDQEYFTDGISEELLNLLARIEGLKVAARTSSFQFKDSNQDITEIGRQLRVGTVLEGSVRKAGDQIRITAQLIDVNEGFHLWSESYDRRLDNIFQVQDEIASAIVEALKLELDVGARPEAITNSVEAFDLYLRGRQYARDPSKEGLLRALEFYHQAIAIDPGFARAHAGIADAYVWLEDFGGMLGSDVFPQAEAAARRALELDPELAEAHFSMGFLQERFHEDSFAAQESYQQALRINPNFAMTYVMYPSTLIKIGDYQKAHNVARLGVDINPLSGFMRARGAWYVALVEGMQGGLAQLDEILLANPDDTYAIEEKANIYRIDRRLAESFVLYARNHRLRPGDPFAAAHAAILAARMDDRALADEWLAKSRSYGANNRWENAARLAIAESIGDWQALRSLAMESSGWYRQTVQGRVAFRDGEFEAAEEHFSAGLDALNYAVGKVVSPQVDLLLRRELARHRMGIEPAPLADVREFVDRVSAQGIAKTNDAYTDIIRAKLAILAGDRDNALQHLRRAIAARYSDFWFLDRDPFFEPYRDDPDFRVVAEQLLAIGRAQRRQLTDMLDPSLD